MNGVHGFQPFEHAIPDHRCSSARCSFFIRLKEHANGAVKTAPRPMQHKGRTDGDRRVHVVSTEMSHARFRRSICRRLRILSRKGIHVGSIPYGGAGVLSFDVYE